MIQKLSKTPISGERSILYGQSSKGLVDFKKLKISQQLEILNGPELPVFPLTDTVSILAPKYFFSDGLLYKTGDVTFICESSSRKHIGGRTLTLKLAGLSTDIINLLFAIEEEEDLYYRYNF